VITNRMPAYSLSISSRNCLRLGCRRLSKVNCTDIGHNFLKSHNFSSYILLIKWCYINSLWLINSYICLCIFYFILLWLYSPLLGLGRYFSFLIQYTVSRTPWTGDQPVSRPLFTHRTIQTQNKRTWTSMPWVWSESTTPVLSGRRHFMPYTARPLWSHACI
jgi:hypothetical protein